MLNKEKTFFLRKKSTRLLTVLILSLALFFSVQVALTDKPTPGTETTDTYTSMNTDALQDRVLFGSNPERFSLVTLPQLPVPATPIPLPETTWRIGIITDGLYALDYISLANAGVPVTASAANDFHVLWRGEELALDGIGLEDTTFDPGDALLFYGEKFHGSTQNEKYTDENVYWLTVSSASSGLRMTGRDVSPVEMLPPATICTGTTAIEENRLYWARFSTSPGTDTTWFWEKIPKSTGVTDTYPISLNNPATTGAALLEVEVAPASTANHLVRLAINGTYLGEWTWSGKVGKIIDAVIPQYLLIDGSNNLQIYTSELRQTLYFDRAKITYNRQPVAGPDGLMCDGNVHVASTYTITNVPANARLYDVSDPLHPVSLTNFAVNGQNLTFRESITGEVRYLTQPPGGVTVTKYNPDLTLLTPELGADEIIIAPRQFLSALSPLVAHRESQGLRVSAIAVEDIYPLFNGGVFHPEAIRAFVAYAYANWPGDAPQYLFLVGDGNFNFKGYNPVDYGAYTPSWIPPYLAFDDPNQGEVPLDVLFGDVNGDGVPEVMVGRIPAQTVTEVTAYVNKILNYEAQPAADWQSQALLVADNGATYDEGFDSMLTRLETYIPSYIATTRIFMEDYCAPSLTTPCPTVTQAVMQSWNAGASLMIYSGHGSIHRWAHEPLLFNVDLSALTETNKLPFLLSLDCWDGYWMFPPTYPALQGRDVRSIGEWATTVLTQTGAIANFGPAGLAYAYEQERMTEAMLDLLFVGKELHLGQLTQAGRAVIQYSYLSRIMTLLGDPAIPLNIPLPSDLYTVSGWVRDGDSMGIEGVLVDSGTYSSTTSATGQYTITGLISGTYTLSASRAGYTFTPPSLVVTVPPDAMDIDFVGALSTVNQVFFVLLPVTLRDFRPFPGPWEQEPNNSYLESNGAIQSGWEYYGYPNDAKDYFSFYMRNAGDITIDLTNHTGEQPQLQLFYKIVDAGGRVAEKLLPPYHIEYHGDPGWYYVYIYSAGAYNSTTPYTLIVTYQQQ